jgi:hypothetical protein
MSALRSLVIALSLIGCITVARAEAASEDPAPVGGAQQEQPKAGEPNQASPEQPKATSPQPTIVYIHPPAKTEAEAEEERKERHEKADLDRRLVDLTAELSDYTGGLYRATFALVIANVLLVVVTAGLVAFAFIQSRDMKESIRSAAKSAVAAENSVAITLATQKAKLEISRFEQQALSGVGSLIGFTISAVWKNFGNLTALRMNLNLQVKFVAPEGVANLTFVVRKHPETKDNLSPGNEVSTSPIPIGPDQAVDCWQRKLRIFVFSQASYNDMIELHGPERLISEHCSEVIFQIDPNLMLLPTAGVGPFSAQMVRYSGYRVETEEDAEPSGPRPHGAALSA